MNEDEGKKTLSPFSDLKFSSLVGLKLHFSFNFLMNKNGNVCFLVHQMMETIFQKIFIIKEKKKENKVKVFFSNFLLGGILTFHFLVVTYGMVFNKSGIRRK